MQATPASPPPIRIRKMEFPFAEGEIPKWWFRNNPLITHASNGLSLLFPAGERFFIRSVRHYMDQIEDPELRSRIKGFFGQEVRHGLEHERANAILEEHGLDLDGFLDLYNRIAFDKLEPHLPPILRLSVTVALEHMTACFAHSALTDDFILGAHPLMVQLIRWHACEEIEHKSVAFDVLQQVDPRYSIRVAGLLIATTQLVGWWMLATRHLMKQESLSPPEIERYRREAREARGREGGVDWDVIKGAFIEYLRPGFHPNERDDYDLARAYLEGVGAA